MKIDNKIYNLIEILKPSKIYLSFSGGIDSTALLLGVNKCCKKMNIPVKVIHFEHGIRGEESLKDAEWCRNFCRVRRIPCRIVALNIPNAKNLNSNLEAAARSLRIKFWNNKIESENSEKELVFLGHQSDDSAENFFLMAARGANSHGLSSMRETVRIGHVNFFRPLLAFSKNKLKKYLKSLGVDDCRDDSTNRDIKFKRNFIRHKIIPEYFQAMPHAEEGIKHTISALRKDDDFIRKCTEKAFEEFKKSGFSADFLSKQHPAVFHRILRIWISEAVHEDFVPNIKLSDRLKKLIANPVENGEKKLSPVNKHFSIALRNAFLSIEKNKNKQNEKIPEKKLWNRLKNPSVKFGKFKLKTEKISEIKCFYSENEKTAYFDEKKMPENLVLRTLRNGDRMIPFGSKSHVKLKKIFSDRKINSDEKKQIPLLCTLEDEIIWIPGVKRANFATLKENIKNNVLKITSDDNSSPKLKII